MEILGKKEESAQITRGRVSEARAESAPAISGRESLNMLTCRRVREGSGEGR